MHKTTPFYPLSRRGLKTKGRKVANIIEQWNETIDLPGLLLQYGENLEREGLKDTPRRMNKAWKEQLIGYSLDPKKILARTFEVEDGAQHQIVICKDISFTSMCEHHLIPFFGHITIAYTPDSKVVGLSKLPRLVECFARRLQIQERLAVQIATAIREHIDPKGVYVTAKAVHLCCKGRGVVQYPMQMITTQKYGQMDMTYLNMLLNTKTPGDAQ